MLFPSPPIQASFRKAIENETKPEIVLFQGDAAMASTAEVPVEELCDEITCSICLEYFKEPVTIDCGHNFCRDCLTQCWGKSDTNLSCPQCREAVQQRNFRSNRLVARVVALVKKHQEGKRGECGRHQEALKLFCKEDDVPICVVCDRSKEHRTHNVVPAEEAVEEYKVKIQAQLQTLEQERDHLVDQKLAEEQRSQKYLTQLEMEKQKIRSSFEQMENFLEEKKYSCLAQLRDLEKKIEKRQKENVTRFSEEISSLTHLIAEMEEKCQQSVHEFLQNIRSTLTRYQKGQVKPLFKISADLEEILASCSYQNSVLKWNMEKCQEFLQHPLYTEDLDRLLEKVNVTLDPDTAHPILALSEDLKSVKYEYRSQELPDNPERFDCMPYVLGREGFISGRHWWEVEVQMETEQWSMWAVGAARDSVRRKGKTSCDLKEGIWAVGKDSGSPFHLLAFSSLGPIPLTLRHVPRKIWVSLDYEEGHVEFFDADTHDRIFTFHSASFSGEGIRPFFAAWDGARLKC